MKTKINKMPLFIEITIKDKEGKVLRKIKEECTQVNIEYNKSEHANGYGLQYLVNGYDIHIEK